MFFAGRVTGRRSTTQRPLAGLSLPVGSDERADEGLEDRILRRDGLRRHNPIARDSTVIFPPQGIVLCLEDFKDVENPLEEPPDLLPRPERRSQALR